MFGVKCAARRALEEHELDILRGRAARVALESGGGVDRIDTDADNGTTTVNIQVVRRAVVL